MNISENFNSSLLSDDNNNTRKGVVNYLIGADSTQGYKFEINKFIEEIQPSNGTINIDAAINKLSSILSSTLLINFSWL